jgi:hypothetical protein
LGNSLGYIELIINTRNWFSGQYMVKFKTNTEEKTFPIIKVVP